MGDGIYVSMNGAAARLAQLDAVADNLANAQTPGFKAERPSFESFLANARGPRVDRIYPAAIATRVDLSPGPIVQTGEPLDVLPERDAFLAVQTATGLAFTRDGHLNVGPDGVLRSGSSPVVDRRGEPIAVPPRTVVRIDAQGFVTADRARIADLALYALDGPVDRIAPTLVVPHRPESARPVETGVRVGEIETGNATPLEAVVQLVSAQRAYEATLQALQTSKQLDSRMTEVGRLR